jgi:hypothetical protein
MHSMELVSDMGRVESRFTMFGDSLVSVQDRYTVCIEHTIGIEILLDALDGTRR